MSGIFSLLPLYVLLGSNKLNSIVAYVSSKFVFSAKWVFQIVKIVTQGGDNI